MSCFILYVFRLKILTMKLAEGKQHGHFMKTSIEFWVRGQLQHHQFYLIVEEVLALHIL